MQIIQEDKDIILIYKPAGIATQTARLGEMDLYSEIRNYLAIRSKEREPYLAIINRLDQPVEGLVLLAKNKKAAAFLSEELKQENIKKKYLALVFGTMDDKKGLFIDYLRKNSKTNLSEVVPKENKDAKRAELKYCIRNARDNMTLLSIELISGRHHQIRLQLSHHGYPLLGDLKYGTQNSISCSREQGIQLIALCAYQLSFLHPTSGEQREYEITPKSIAIQKMM